MSLPKQVPGFRLLCHRVMSNGSVRISVIRYASYEEAAEAFFTSKTRDLSFYVLQQESNADILMVSNIGKTTFRYACRLGNSQKKRLYPYYCAELLLTKAKAKEMFYDGQDN